MIKMKLHLNGHTNLYQIKCLLWVLDPKMTFDPCGVIMCVRVHVCVEYSAGCPPGVNSVCCTGLTADWLPHRQRQRPCHGEDLREAHWGECLHFVHVCEFV